MMNDNKLILFIFNNVNIIIDTNDSSITISLFINIFNDFFFLFFHFII